MVLKAIKHTSRDNEGNEVISWTVVDENGETAKGNFIVKDGRPFDLIMNDYAD